MNGEINRKLLIHKISRSSGAIRKEAKLRQDDLAAILGISKNTIVNVENSIPTEEKNYSWPVVMSMITLFSSTEAVKEIFADENHIEIMMKCAFLDIKDKEKSNRMLYEHSFESILKLGLKAAAITLPMLIGSNVIDSIFNPLKKIR